MKRLLVDGADITAVIPHFSNRLIVPDVFDELLHRKRTTVVLLCAEVGIKTKTLWRFRQRQRVLPVTTGWRISSVLRCRIGDFTAQHPDAAMTARINSIVWDARELSPDKFTELIQQLTAQGAGHEQ